ncbi:MAG: acyl-CoA dehydrogenase family protein [Actinomycetota bacterium]
MTGLYAERLFDQLSPSEARRAGIVESVLPELAARAVEADRTAEFPRSHVALLAESGLLGLVVPERFGGLGGGLRDLVGATFAMGSACPSTALSFFFHCSSASRGLLALEALDAGLFPDSDVAVVEAFAARVLNLMGRDRVWLANFASESAKSASANVTIATSATPCTRDGRSGWSLNGVKSFGCATGVAGRYLVTASIGGGTTAENLAIFIVDPSSPGVGERAKWDAIGMRATATHGITLDDVFVSEEDSLAIPGAFVRMMQMSRGSFVGSQVAGTAVYLGAAHALYDWTLGHLTDTKFSDTGASIGTAPFQQQLIGEMRMHLDTATLWLRRQVDLETSEPPILPKNDVVRQWRIAKGTVTDEAFAVAMCAMKASGTSNTTNSGPVARGLRDLSMGLVQAFPSEKGRLEAASLIVSGAESTQFGAKS